MTMKLHRLFLLASVLCITFISIAQPRTNNTSSYFKVLASSQIVSSPVGWYYDDVSERWSGYYGAICGEYSNNHKIPKRMSADDLSGFGDDGILSLQVKKVKSADKIFYLLYHRFWDGEFDYPAIQRGWRYWKNCNVYIIEESEFNKFLNPEIGINKIKILDYENPYDMGLLKGEATLNSNLNTKFKEISRATPDKPYKSYWSDYVIYLKLEEDGKTVRFHLPSNKMLLSEAKEINRQNELNRANNPYRYYSDVSTYDCIDFGSKYFELTPLQYSTLKLK